MTDIIPVNAVSFHTFHHLFNERNVLNLFFGNNGKRIWKCIRYGQGIVQSLMIRVQHKSLLFRQIFHAVAVHLHSSAFVGAVYDRLYHFIMFFIRIFICMFRMAAKLDPVSGNQKKIVKHHYQDSPHTVILLFRDKKCVRLQDSCLSQKFRSQTLVSFIRNSSALLNRYMQNPFKIACGDGILHS